MDSDLSIDTDYLPIREVSRLTGVNPVTLRAWQRRYGLIKPARTEKGHRLYSPEDIECIYKILHWLEQGVSIGEVKSLLVEPKPVVKKDDHWLLAQHKLLQLAQALKSSALKLELGQLAKAYPTELFLRHIVQPWLALLAQQGRPDEDIIQASAQACLTEFLYQHISIKSGPTIGVACVGDVSDLSLLLLQYELQGLECQSQNFANLDVKALSIVQSRLSVQAWVIQLGTGLSQRWFAERHALWPSTTLFVGECGLIYQQKDWLNPFPYSPSVNEWAKQHEFPSSLVSK